MGTRLITLDLLWVGGTGRHWLPQLERVIPIFDEETGTQVIVASFSPF